MGPKLWLFQGHPCEAPRVAHDSEFGELPPLGLPSPGSQLRAVSRELQEHVSRLRGVGRVGKPGRIQYHRDKGSRGSSKEAFWGPSFYWVSG